MDYTIVSLLLLVWVVVVDMQVMHEPEWDVHKNIREIISLKNIHERNVRETGASAQNGKYTIDSGVEVGICLNITQKKTVKYEVRRKSTLNYAYKPGCTNTRSMMDCFEPRLNYTNEIVPVEHLVKVRTPFCCEGYEQVASKSSGSTEESSYISRSWPDGDIYCKPICDPPCIKGFCASPKVCKCPKEMVLLEDKRTCEAPKCEPECVNADCVGRNTCKCHRLYVKDAAEPNFCRPHCSIPCKNNSYCYFPNECRCMKGYRRNPTTEQCEPVCQLNCVNGFCSGVNECTCHNGFQKVVGSSNKCEPKCENCANGVCTAPGVCKCNDLYKYNETTKNCTPECPGDCKRGCDTPMQCRGCGKGYKMNNVSLDCEPECEGCINGVCTAPGVCKCKNLYKFNETTNNCTPECPGDCKRGCVTPMQCRGCEKGYKIKEGSLDCEPVCEGCNNGVCTAPGVCKCNDLYKFNETTKNCTPECPKDCTRGCDKPLQCKGCEEGYKKKNGSLDCEPECKGCKNGDCMAPGVCICEEGYARDLEDTECVPKCVPECKIGVCSAPQTCSCLKGYHLVSENICESDTQSCWQSIEDQIKPDNNSCVNMHEPLKMYTENCSAHFTNSSCFDELCPLWDDRFADYQNRHDVCDMQYMCEFVGVASFTMLHSHSSQLQCRWRKRKVEFESSDPMVVGGSSDKMQDDNQLFDSLHFFRPDFDVKPCLLCLCPVNKTREFCMNGSYAFELCSCVSEKAVIMRDSERGFFHRHNHFYNYILYTIGLLLLLLVVLIAVKIKCDNMKIAAKTYTVSSFSNDLYCEGSKFEEAEHVYAEIECDGLDGYEEPKNIVLKFD